MACGGALVELIEAGARVGRPDEAAAALESLSEAHASEWHRLGTRRRGPLAGAASEPDKQKSPLPRSDRSACRRRSVLDLARAQLVYGEWLRRDEPTHGRARATPARP